MKTKTILSLMLLLSHFCQASEFVVLKFGETLSIPDGKIALLHSANFNYVSTTDANDNVIPEIARLQLFGTINGEVVKLEPTDLGRVAPVFDLATSASGLGHLGQGFGDQVKNLAIQGPIELRMGVFANSTPISMKPDFNAALIIQLENEGSSQSIPLIPASSVLIPSDSSGPIEVILESSTDLVNWTGALPGTYGSSSENRFFRVRAVINTD
jgi:hypothetical protein